MTDETISGAELFALRSSWGLSITDIAHTLGVHEDIISRWKSDEKPLRPNVAAEILAIDLTLDEIADELTSRGATTMARGETPEWCCAPPNMFMSAVGRAVMRGHRVDWK